MQVILQKTHPNLGLVGDTVNVSPGFYRNFLAPRGIALLADQGNVRKWEHQKKVIEIKKAQAKQEALAIEKRLAEQVFELEHLAGEKDKLFGSITSSEIAATLEQGGFVVDRRLILLDAPIKALGEYEVSVKLHPDVVAQIKIRIRGKGRPEGTTVRAEPAAAGQEGAEPVVLESEVSKT